MAGVAGDATAVAGDLIAEVPELVTSFSPPFPHAQRNSARMAVRVIDPSSVARP
jgi:hypothetical protein